MGHADPTVNDRQRAGARMQIVYMMGGHGTDADQVFNGLMKAETALSRHGVAVARPRRLRRALEPVAARLKDGAPPDGDDSGLPARLGLPAETRRAVLFGEVLLGPPGHVAREALLYPFIAGRGRLLRDAAAGHETEFAMTLRNPATLLPALARRAAPDGVRGFLDGLRPSGLRWLHTLRRLREAAPGVPVIAWCHEDTPLLWDRIVERITGLRPAPDRAGAVAAGEPDGDAAVAARDAAGDGPWTAYMRGLLTEEGAARLAAALAATPRPGPDETRALVADALARHARPGTLEMELADTGWSQATVDRMTGNYHDDLDQIAGMEGVTLLTPWPEPG